MGKISCLILILIFASFGFGQEKIPLEVSEEMSAFIDEIDPSLKTMQWNRWVTENFVICSLENAQGKYIHENAEAIRVWMQQRWGLPESKSEKIVVQDLGEEPFVRIICVHDPVLFKKFFRIDSSKVEVRKKNDKVELIVAFLLLDDVPSKVLPKPLTQINLALVSNYSGNELGWWIIRGMGVLNQPILKIRDDIASLRKPFNADKNMFFGKGIFSVKEDDWIKFSEENKYLFDCECATLCLMLRQEYGQDKFMWLYRESQNPESVLNNVYKFKTFSTLDKQFKQYIDQITSDILGLDPKRKQPPDYYFNIIPDNSWRPNFSW